MTQERRKLSAKERVVGIGRVAKITYKASPLAVFIKIFGAIVNAVLPIVTTYFAALTTTAHQVLSYLAVSGSDSRWRAISTAIVRL